MPPEVTIPADALEVPGMLKLRRAVVAALSGGILSLAMAGTAFAGIPDTTAEIHADGTHDASTVVCTFHIHFTASAEDPEEAGHWEIWSSGGQLVLSGQYAGAETMAPASGAYELDEGTYELRWDDEPVDLSRTTLTFEVACEEASSPPSEAPASEAPPSEAPPSEMPSAPPTGSEAPTGSELPIGSEVPAGSEVPTGGVGGLVGTPQPTLPPTDTAGSLSGIATAAPLIAILVMITASIIFLVRPVTAEVRRNR